MLSLFVYHIAKNLAEKLWRNGTSAGDIGEKITLANPRPVYIFIIVHTRQL